MAGSNVTRLGLLDGGPIPLDSGPVDYTLPPHDSDAEQSVLGAVLKQPTCMAKLGQLRAEDFYEPKYRAVWRAMGDLWDRNVPIDYATLGNRLKAEDLASAQVTLVDLTAIDLVVPTAAHVEHYARIVGDMATKRRFIDQAQHIAELWWKPGDVDVADLVRQTDALLAAARPNTSRRDLHDPERWGQEFLDDLTLRKLGQRTAVCSGLLDLDDMTFGFEAGRLYLLCAVSGTGKSELAMQIAMNVALHDGPVLLASLEMTAVELAHRYARIKHGLDRNYLAAAQLTEEEWAIAARIREEMQAGRMWPSTPGGAYTTADLRADAMEVQAKEGKLALIVADYVQRFRDKAGRNSNREQDVGLVAENLKSLAREFGCPVLAPVQPNREYTRRPSNPRPVLSDLRESGKLEQEADVVLGLYRDEKHNPETRERGIAEIIMLKNRSGVGVSDGSRKLVWRGSRYDNYAPRATGLVA